MRKSWDEYFLDIADVVSTRSTCDRRHVGAVIVKDNRALSMGYNGSLHGEGHCDDIGHEIVNNHCIRTVHAEANAILQAANHGVSVKGAVMYINTPPCYNCFKLCMNSGISSIVYRGEYFHDPMVEVKSKELGFSIKRIRENFPDEAGTNNQS